MMYNVKGISEKYLNIIRNRPVCGTFRQKCVAAVNRRKEIYFKVAKMVNEKVTILAILTILI